MASSSEKPIHLAQTNNIHICQREFCSHLARSRMPKRRGEFQMSLSQESSLLAQTFCRTSNQFTLGKARSRQLMRRSFFSSCGKIGNRRFRTNFDRCIPTTFRRSFSFQSPAGSGNTWSGSRRIAPDKLGIEARPLITNYDFFLAWGDTFILARVRRRFSRSTDHRGADPTRAAVSIHRS
jgi:hypothetical protein